MYTVELDRLEKQISILLDAYLKLKDENLQLKNQLAGSSRERAKLQTKNHELAKQVKTIISQLKEEMS